MDGADETVKRRRYVVHSKERYPIWVCPDCGFGITSNKWRLHRRRCTGHDDCPACGTPFPCRNTLCPKRERPNRVAIPNEVPGLAPRVAMLYRMKIEAKRLEDKTWKGRWTNGAWVTAKTWPALYELLVRRQRNGLP